MSCLLAARFAQGTLAHLYAEVNIATPRRCIHACHIASYMILAYAWQHKTGTDKQVHRDISVFRIYHENVSKIYGKL